MIILQSQDVLMKKWSIGQPDMKISATLAAQCGLSQLCASVLVSRGIDTPEKAKEFFNYSEDGSSPLADPFIIRGIDDAAQLITAAVNCETPICIYGDYDCDGIAATAVLYTYLKTAEANVTYHINMRSDGYGINKEAIKMLAEQGIEMIITVDNGISAIEEAELAKELDITLIITDHHQPGDELPDAAAIVNPHRDDCPTEFKDLCGCGVVLKLLAAMDGGMYDIVMEEFSDLTALATIADVVPLRSENREIVSKGLHYLGNTENEGLRALMEIAGIRTPVSATSAAFGLSPRINASGRFGSASDAVEMLIADDPETARMYAKKLDALNSMRKEEEQRISADIEKLISSDPDLLCRRVLVVYGENWHHGVIGIVAARLTEKFGKPCFVISGENGEARGSARSVEGFSIFEALTYCKHILTKFGGHTGAGGFSLPCEKVAEFDAALQAYAEGLSVMPVFTVHADKLILPSELTVENVSSLSILEPFGEGNRQPLFLMHPVKLLDTAALSGGAHTRLKLDYGGVTVTGLMFGQKTADFPYKTGDMLDMLVYPEINTYNGRTSVNIRIADCRAAGISQQKYFLAKDAYEQFRRSGKADKRLASRFIPRREDFALIYRAMPRDSSPIAADLLFARLKESDMSYCMLRCALDIFEKLGLVRLDTYNDTAAIVPNAPKVDIENSAPLAELRKVFN